jgi:hypothetical protein
MSILATYADVMYDLLPARDYQEILTGMQRTFTNFTKEMVNNTIAWVRRNPDEAGYNIGYIKAGTPGWDEGLRLFAINKNDPSFKFDDDQREHFDNGLLMTVLGIDTRIRLQVEMLEAGQVHEVKRVYREAYEDYAYALQGMVRAIKRAQRIIREKQAANGGGGGST